MSMRRSRVSKIVSCMRALDHGSLQPLLWPAANRRLGRVVSLIKQARTMASGKEGREGGGRRRALPAQVQDAVAKGDSGPWVFLSAFGVLGCLLEVSAPLRCCSGSKVL